MSGSFHAYTRKILGRLLVFFSSQHEKKSPNQERGEIIPIGDEATPSGDVLAELRDSRKD